MKEFEKWFDRELTKDNRWRSRDEWADNAWKAALEWALTQDTDLNSTELAYAVRKELRI